jgi:hypothetical protein
VVLEAMPTAQVAHNNGTESWQVNKSGSPEEIAEWLLAKFRLHYPVSRKPILLVNDQLLKSSIIIIVQEMAERPGVTVRFRDYRLAIFGVGSFHFL